MFDFEFQRRFCVRLATSRGAEKTRKNGQTGPKRHEIGVIEHGGDDSVNLRGRGGLLHEEFLKIKLGSSLKRETELRSSTCKSILDAAVRARGVLKSKNEIKGPLTQQPGSFGSKGGTQRSQRKNLVSAHLRLQFRRGRHQLRVS